MLSFSRGDTIIEVMLAITIFSLVAMGAITIMNQGTNSAERSLEVTQVKQEIDAQAEALRAAQLAHLANPTSSDAWSGVKGMRDQAPLPINDTTCPSFSGVHVFAMDGHNASLIKSPQMKTSDDRHAPPYAKIDYATGTTYGLWIEKKTTPSGDGKPGYFDFRIRACWYGPGLGVPMTLQTVVRLYNA